MGLLLDLEDNVACLDTGRLVTLAAELDLGAALDATIDMDVENLAVNHSLLSVAVLAPVLLLDNLSLAIAVRAHGLEALDHGTHLSHHGLHSVAIASCASSDSAFLATAALALGADDGSLQSQLGDLSLVDVFQRNLVGVVDGSCLGRAAVLHAAEHATQTAAKAAAAASEELSEEIFGSHATTSGSTFKACLAILVVYRALLGVGKDFIGVGDLLELFLRAGVVCVLV